MEIISVEQISRLDTNSNVRFRFILAKQRHIWTKFIYVDLIKAIVYGTVLANDIDTECRVSMGQAFAEVKLPGIRRQAGDRAGDARGRIDHPGPAPGGLSADQPARE